MLKDITNGQHFPGDSIVHRTDPRLKILLVIAYIVLLFTINNFLGLDSFLMANGNRFGGVIPEKPCVW